MLNGNVTIYDKETDLIMVQYKQFNGIYYITLNDLIKLQEFRNERLAMANSVIEDRDELRILHERTGHVGKSMLVEAYRSRLVTGVHLPRKLYARKAVARQRKCNICSRIKLTRHQFRREKLRSVRFIGETVSTDLAVFPNCPSREGVQYVQTFTDHASKFVTAYMD